MFNYKNWQNLKKKFFWVLFFGFGGDVRGEIFFIPYPMTIFWLRVLHKNDSNKIIVEIFRKQFFVLLIIL